MKTPKIIALALALFSAVAAPAMAAPITYDVSIPLIADGSDSAVATDSLFGQLTYDDTLWTGSGTFTIASLAGTTLVSQFFSGWSILVDMGDGGLGLYFDAMQDDGTGLYLNINTGTTADTLSFSNVSYSQTSGTTFFTSIGGSVTAVAVTPEVMTGVSPVPLPPAAWLFGGALLGLATTRRLAPLVRIAARR